MDQRTARVGKNDRAKRTGNDVAPLPRPADWSGFLASGVNVSDDFLANIEDLPAQERRLA